MNQVDGDNGPVSVQTPDSALRNPGKLARSIVADIWAGRELAWRMFLRNIRALYRQTFLGLFWAFLPPLANTAVWVILRNSKTVDLAPGVNNYAVYVMTGMVIWQSFVEALQAPIQAVQSNRSLLSKLKFPRESILLVKFFEVLFNLSVRCVVLIPLLLFLGPDQWTSSVFLAPLLILLLIVLGFAIGLFLMPAGMLYQDVTKALMVSIPVWMILTPIIYQPPPNWSSHPLNYLNPAGPMLSVARDLLVAGQIDYALYPAVYVYAGIALPLMITGIVLFRLSIPVLVERISS